MKIITAEQLSPEWFASRLGKPTGSGYSKVLAKGEGKTRQAYLIKLALELATGVIDDSFKNQAMQDGTEREPFARGLYESSRGVFVDEVGFCLHDKLDTGVSPDGLIGASGMIEIKSPTPPVHREYMALKKEPATYTAQIQGQLWVCEREWCDFVSYQPEFPDNARLLVRRVFRDDAYIKNLEAQVIQFIYELHSEVEFIRNYKEAA